MEVAWSPISPFHLPWRHHPAAERPSPTAETSNSAATNSNHERSSMEPLSTKNNANDTSTNLSRFEHQESQMDQKKPVVETHESTTTDETFHELMDEIDKCRTIHEFEKVYLSKHYQMWFTCIESAQTGKDRNVWAKQWAEHLSQGDHETIILNYARKVCLRLIYAICNCWKPKDPSGATVSDADIIDIFKPQKISRILSVCLPMDRANALYNMIDRATNQRGMHWYSHKDVSWFQQNGQERRNVHTINKRLNWLFDLDGLGLSSDDELVGYMTPCRTPLADQVVESDDSNVAH